MELKCENQNASTGNWLLWKQAHYNRKWKQRASSSRGQHQLPPTVCAAVGGSSRGYGGFRGLVGYGAICVRLSGKQSPEIKAALPVNSPCIKSLI